MQRIERYGVIALVFLLVTILAVSLWGEGEGRAKEVLASLRGGAGEKVAAAEREKPARAPTSKTPLTGPRTGPRRAAPMSTLAEADPDGRPKKRGRGKSPEVGTPAQDARDGAAPTRTLPTPKNVASDRTQSQAPAKQPEPERAQLVQRNAPRKPASANQGRFYVVRPNETLSEIAQRELGTYKRWTEIQALNGDLDPAKLREGMKLRLPAKGSQAAAARVAEAVQPPAKKPLPTPGATKPKVNGHGSYTVQSGDVLGVIAQRELGSAKRWPEIVALNPGLDPDRVPVGTRLVMPAGAARVQQVAVADTSRVSRPRQSATPSRAQGKVR
jgi:nucleoid-associated protein YgaU